MLNTVKSGYAGKSTFIIVLLLNCLSLCDFIIAQQEDTAKTEPLQIRRGIPLQVGFQSYDEYYAGKNLNEEKRGHFPLSGTGVWTELNPKVPRVDYYGVYFKDELNGFAVGEFGAIIKTTDGGLSWINKSYPTDKTLLRINGSENFIIIVGTVGTILRTNDFGETWNNVDLETNSDIWGVYTFNDTMSLICAKDGKLYKTTDSGNNWKTDSTGILLTHWDLQFMNTDTGFISCSNGKILKTIDGGNSWTEKNTGDFSSLYSIEILPNKKIVTAGASGEIYYSTDFGNTFIHSVIQIPLTVEDLGFANNEIGFAIGAAAISNAINKTTDGGLSWILLQQYMGNLNVDFVSDFIGYNVGMDLNIYKTIDSGESWAHSILNENLISVSIPSDSIGYFLGWYNLYKIAGNKITKVSEGFVGSESKIYFVSDQVGHLIGYNGFLFKTVNGGIDWFLTDSILNYDNRKEIQFITPSMGWYLNSTVLKKTTDNGNSWQQIYKSSGFNDFYFLDSLNGWIVATNKTYKTSDGGDNWEITNTLYSFNDITFKDIDTGFAVNGSVYKTTDGGYNWQLIQGATGYKIQLVDSSMIITWKNEGPVFISMNGGVSWNQYDLPNRKSILFLNKGLGFLVGDEGLIYSYVDSVYVPVELLNFEGRINNNTIILNWNTASELNNLGFEIQKGTGNEGWYTIGFTEGKGTTTEFSYYFFKDDNPMYGFNRYRLKQFDLDGKINYSEMVTVKFLPRYSFELFGNYPNPFNSQTIISFNLPYDSNIELKIFNVLGEQVEKLIFENLSAGLNKINYSAANFNSGVYFYKISNGEKVLMGKMLLIK